MITEHPFLTGQLTLLIRLGFGVCQGLQLGLMGTRLYVVGAALGLCCQEMCNCKDLGNRSMFFPQRMVRHWNRLPSEWSQPQGFQNSRSIWTMLSGTRWDCWSVLCRARACTQRSLGDPSNSAYSVVSYRRPVAAQFLRHRSLS